MISAHIFNIPNIYQLIALFVIYSFMGWLIEVLFRSYTQGRFINAGFLLGPFIPIYGFGAGFVIALDHLCKSYPFPLQFALYGVVLTFTEYAVSFSFERVFKLKLWDYSDNRFNLHGRVCLLYSIFWNIMAVVFIWFIHPGIGRIVTYADGSLLRGASVALMLYFVTDFVFSVISISSFRSKLTYLYNEYLNLPTVEIDRIFNSFRRLRGAFPYLNMYIDRTINLQIRDRINDFLGKIQGKIMAGINGRTPFEKEFYDLIREISTHEEFLKLKDYFHHNSSIYDHVIKVSYFAYRIAKVLKLDYRSAARGGMLHDFFLYDWRNHDEPDLAREKYHGVEHPWIALSNAEKYFTLNDIEKDIILKHMWPLTFVPPRYKESFVVTFADKYLSSREFMDEFRKNKKQRTLDEPVAE